MSADFKSELPPCHAGYRAGVGIILLNDQGLIFAGHRRDARRPAWQLPQGGIMPGESPNDAVQRELSEELGTAKVTMLGRHPDWICYDYPDRTMSKRAVNYRGQCHLWYLLRFDGRDQDIDVGLAHGEFSHFDWLSADQVISEVIGFKKTAYRRALSAFEPAIANFAAHRKAVRRDADKSAPAMLG
jgi:putative (di)nucleoside polyphosphate hydrolase